ncbi:efflux RND transporter permease subunit [Halosimplex salinum]|uniref:efflux RND transporter permease subunit n=1 Tax=Halosimplex salinum TaxID=1710538 RepID=UPI000F47D8EB|nr:MMPL family transporter [Halosimplex salinum]
MNDPLAGVFRFVTDHNLIVILLLVLASAGVAAGTTQLQLESEANGSSAVGDTEVAQKMEYIQQSYGNHSDGNGTATEPVAVYVRDEGDALSKETLLASLRYQQTVRDNESVATSLGDRDVVGVANLVGKRAAGSQDATLEEQITALESASDSEVEQLVAATLSAESPALSLLPSEYEPGTATADSHRMVFQFAADDERRSAATAALYEAAQEHEDPEVFTNGEHASAEINRQAQQNMMTLILPVALLMILVVLAFSYRDLVDVVVGFTGVVLSVLWMFGILGWLEIPAGMTIIIGPVLIIALSVDYGLHVFMRYREERGETEDIRDPMFRGISSVAVALALVTMTAMVGFMSNATNEFTIIKELSFGITLGVLSTFVISLTLVPALKITIDGLLERVGLDRRKEPLGETRLLEPFLRSGATLAKRAAPAVIVLALVAGSAGAVAWTDLDRQAFQQGDGDVAEWKQELPGPLAWEVTDAERNGQFVDENYRAADEDTRRRANVLFEGDVTDPMALESVRAAEDAAADSDVVYQRDGSVPLTSPLTVMQSVAAEDEAFAAAYRDADTDSDGVPDRNVAELYDDLYAAAPDAASQVVDREDGEYRSLRMVVPIRPDATYPGQAEGMRDVAAAADGDGVTAIAVGSGTINAAESAQTADSILTTLVIALTAVGVLLTLVYRLVTGSATLGTLTAVPITLVIALVIGGMWIFEIPLTLLTALLLSLVVGIGIDYNIHVSDRFAQEVERGQTVTGALRTAVTGTGGALLGSTLTSVGAFSALLLHPHPQIQSFGTLVVLALSLSFVVAVFVLPSLLLTWANYGSLDAIRRESPTRDTPMAQD